MFQNSRTTYVRSGRRSRSRSPIVIRPEREGQYGQPYFYGGGDRRENWGLYGQSNAWTLYNETAMDHDRQMLKEWEDTLSTLLIFAGLFSSILAAFIAGSMSTLQEDKLGAMQSILLTISRQIHNATTPFYEPPSFQPLNWAIRVNCYLYASLGCTVSSAIISVLALQWIRGYDMNLPGMANPRTRAVHRHFRFEGLQRWLLPQIISTLPVLLHIALIVFFIALIDWLVHTNAIVAGTIIFITTAVIAFYTTTQLAAIITPSAPFRTPLSHFIRRTVEIIGSIFNLEAGIQAARASLKWQQSSREEKAISKDDLLPSSALVWLLNQNNHREWSIPDTIDILENLTKSENALMLKQSLSKDQERWNNIFGRVIRSLFKRRNPDKTYNPDVEYQFFVALEASLIVGGNSLSPAARSVLLSSPFIQFSYQSTPLGLLCRFALWQNKAPFPIDSNDPPIDLYRRICQSSMNDSPLLVLLCLQQIQSSLLERKISKENVLDCLTSLLHTQSSDNGVLNILSNRELGLLVLSIGLMTFEDSRPFPQGISIEEAMIMILSLHSDRSQVNGVYSHDHVPFIAALLQQFILKLATDDTNDHTLLQLEIFRHPSFASIWMDESAWSDLDLRSLVLERLWQPTQVLYPLGDDPSPRWALQLCQAVMLMISFLPTSIIPFEKDWGIMTAALSTLAICISGSPIEENESYELTANDTGEWLVKLISGLGPAMDNPTIAFVISAMLSGHVRYRLHKHLYGRLGVDPLDSLAKTECVQLRIVSHMLIGTECWRDLPAIGDLAYSSPSFKVIVRNWRGFEPVTFLESDEDLVRALCQTTEGDWKNEVFDFLWTRARQLVYSGNHSPPLGENSHPLYTDMMLVLRAALVAFRNKPSETHEALHLSLRLSEYGSFAKIFTDLNGIDWLYSISFPASENCHICGDILSPTAAVLKLFDATDGFRKLEKSQIQQLLNSNVIYNGSYPEKDAPNIVLLTEQLFECLKELGHEGLYPKAGAACEVILEQERLTGEKAPKQEDETTHRGVGTSRSMNWATSLPTMINELKGSSPPTKKKRTLVLSFPTFTSRAITTDIDTGRSIGLGPDYQGPILASYGTARTRVDYAWPPGYVFQQAPTEGYRIINVRDSSVDRSSSRSHSPLPPIIELSERSPAQTVPILDTPSYPPISHRASTPSSSAQSILSDNGR